MIATPALQVNVTAVPVFLSGARQQSSKSCQAEDAKKVQKHKVQMTAQLYITSPRCNLNETHLSR